MIIPKTVFALTFSITYVVLFCYKYFYNLPVQIVKDSVEDLILTKYLALGYDHVVGQSNGSVWRPYIARLVGISVYLIFLSLALSLTKWILRYSWTLLTSTTKNEVKDVMQSDQGTAKFTDEVASINEFDGQTAVDLSYLDYSACADNFNPKSIKNCSSQSVELPLNESETISPKMVPIDFMEEFEENVLSSMKLRAEEFQAGQRAEDEISSILAKVFLSPNLESQDDQASQTYDDQGECLNIIQNKKYDKLNFNSLEEHNHDPEKETSIDLEGETTIILGNQALLDNNVDRHINYSDNLLECDLNGDNACCTSESPTKVLDVYGGDETNNDEDILLVPICGSRANEPREKEEIDVELDNSSRYSSLERSWNESCLCSSEDDVSEKNEEADVYFPNAISKSFGRISNENCLCNMEYQENCYSRELTDDKSDKNESHTEPPPTLEGQDMILNNEPKSIDMQSLAEAHIKSSDFVNLRPKGEMVSLLIKKLKMQGLVEGNDDGIAAFHPQMNDVPQTKPRSNFKGNMVSNLVFEIEDKTSPCSDGELQIDCASLKPKTYLEDEHIAENQPYPCTSRFFLPLPKSEKELGNNVSCDTNTKDRQDDLKTRFCQETSNLYDLKVGIKTASIDASFSDHDAVKDMPECKNREMSVSSDEDTCSSNCEDCLNLQQAYESSLERDTTLEKNIDSSENDIELAKCMKWVSSVDSILGQKIEMNHQ